MVAAANKALSATADGNQKKPVFPGFIPLGASPQATAAALAARQAPNVLAGTGLGLNAPAQAPAMFTDGLGPRPAPQPEPAKKMGWNDVPPLRAPDNARNIYANMGVDDLKSRANLTGVQATTQAPAPQATGTRGLSGLVGSTNDIMPRTRTVMSQSGQSISNLVNNGQYGAAAGEAVRGAAAMFPAVGLDVIAPLAPMGQGMVNATHQYATGESPAATPAVAAPQQASYSNEGKNYPASGKTASPAQTTSLPAPKAGDGLPAGRDLTGALSAMPVDLPRDQMAANAIYKTTDPKTGRTVYSGYGDPSKPSFGLNQGIFDGKGNEIQRTGGQLFIADADSPVVTTPNGGFGFTPSQYGDKGPPADVLAARQAKTDAALANPDGTKWSDWDNKVMAANIRDGRRGGEAYYGTSRDPRNTPEGIAAAAAQAEANRPTMAQRLMDQRSPESIMLRNLQMSLDMKPNESPTQYQSRAAAVQSQINNILGEDARRSADNQAAAKTRLESAKLAADQKSGAAKLGLDAQRLSMEQQNAVPARQLNEMEIAASKQLQSLRDRFMAATGAEQEALGKQLLTMSGKDPKSSMKENFMVVGGGQEWDAQANSMRNVPQTLIDLRTGKPVGGDVGGAKAPTTAVDFLKKNPSQAQAFKDKYGYLPEGFKQ